LTGSLAVYNLPALVMIGWQRAGIWLKFTFEKRYVKIFLLRADEKSPYINRLSESGKL
jgi:hypothetical protein